MPSERLDIIRDPWPEGSDDIFASRGAEFITLFGGCGRPRGRSRRARSSPGGTRRIGVLMGLASTRRLGFCHFSNLISGLGKGLFKDNRRVMSGGDSQAHCDLRVGQGDCNRASLRFRLPGHTPGHTSYVIASGSARLFVFSDVTNRPGAVRVQSPAGTPSSIRFRTWRKRRGEKSLDMLIADKMLVQTFHAPFPALGHMEKGRPELSVRPRLPGARLSDLRETSSQMQGRPSGCRRGGVMNLRRVIRSPSSARLLQEPGYVRGPSALAVLRFTTSSNLVGACTGRSPGFSPRRNAVYVRCPRLDTPPVLLIA